MERSIILFTTCALIGCAKDDGLMDEVGTPQALTINEVVSAGSEQVNEFGDRSDWFEIHNAGAQIQLEAGEWYITDDPEQPLKYELPSAVIPEQGSLVIWCDGMDIVGQQIHASFALDAEGETIQLSHRTAEGVTVVNTVEIGRMHGIRGVSMGRYPDGTDTWQPLNPPTPGAPNEPVDAL